MDLQYFVPLHAGHRSSPHSPDNFGETLRSSTCPFPNFIGYLVNIFLVDVNLQSLFRIKRELAHLSDMRKSHNGHTRLNTKVLEGTRSLSLHFILNWNTKGTGRERERNGKGMQTEREGNANGTGRERELERFKNAFSAAFSVRFLLSGTVIRLLLTLFLKL